MMDKTLKILGSPESNNTKKFPIYIVICSLITSYIAGIAISQDFSRQPIGKASFKL